MNWTDTQDIAIELADNHTDIDPLTISFVRLRELVLEIEGFEGAEDGCNEKILEAIQMSWIDER